jgi:hypothetical protein
MSAQRALAPLSSSTLRAYSQIANDGDDTRKYSFDRSCYDLSPWLGTLYPLVGWFLAPQHLFASIRVNTQSLKPDSAFGHPMEAGGGGEEWGEARFVGEENARGEELTKMGEP